MRHVTEPLQLFPFINGNVLNSSGSVFAGTSHIVPYIYGRVGPQISPCIYGTGVEGFRQKRCRNCLVRFRSLTEIHVKVPSYASCIFTERSVNYRKVGNGNSPLINGCSVKNGNIPYQHEANGP